MTVQNGSKEEMKKKKHPHKLHDCVAIGDNFLPALLAYFKEI
jgi:hypothetical protein